MGIMLVAAAARLGEGTPARSSAGTASEGCCLWEGKGSSVQAGTTWPTASRWE